MTLIMQNKANLMDAQMNLSSVLTKDYENELCRKLQENKPNQTQFLSDIIIPCPGAYDLIRLLPE